MLSPSRLQHISVIAGISVVYGLVGFGNYLLTPIERYVDVHSRLDDMVPFQAVFAWPYLFYYFLLGIPLVLSLPLPDLKLLWRRLAIASGISALVFIVVPTVPLRIENVQLLPGIAPWIIAMIYKIDPPSNCFPSLHVLHSFLIAGSYFKVAKLRRFGILFYAMACGVALATVFIKQHFVADVIAALFLTPVIAMAAQLTFQKLRRYRKELKELFAGL